MKMKLGWSAARTGEALKHSKLSNVIKYKSKRWIIVLLRYFCVALLADLAPEVDSQE
jgi:hypothetical protein